MCPQQRRAGLGDAVDLVPAAVERLAELEGVRRALVDDEHAIPPRCVFHVDLLRNSRAAATTHGRHARGAGLTVSGQFDVPVREMTTDRQTNRRPP